MTQNQNNGSKSYLISIVLVAVLGGLLFGYDTAVISGAEKGLQAFFMEAKDFTYTDGWHGFTSASALIGCIIGSAFSGLLATNLGRKKSLIIAGLLFFVSALGSMYPEFLFFAKGEPTFSLLIMFNIYRVIGGIGVGLASAICPMYIGEVAPSNIRGMLVSWNQFAIIFGQLVVYFVNFFILGDHIQPVVEEMGKGLAAINPAAQWTVTTGWRYMFGSEAVPAGLFALLICFVPETPRYLVSIGDDKKALTVLSRINGMEKAQQILQDIRDTMTEKTERLMTYGAMCIFVGIMLSVFQQAVGINAVLYYAPRIFGDMGMENPMVVTVFMGVINILFTLVAVFTRTGDGDRRIHHGLFGLVHVLVGPHLLGAHRRDIPQHHPWRRRGHRRGFPVDIQLHRQLHLRAYVQHAPQRGRRLRPLVHLRPLWHHLRRCRHLRLEAGSRDQGQDARGYDQALEEGLGAFQGRHPTTAACPVGPAAGGGCNKGGHLLFQRCPPLSLSKINCTKSMSCLPYHSDHHFHCKCCLVRTPPCGCTLFSPFS